MRRPAEAGSDVNGRAIIYAFARQRANGRRNILGVQIAPLETFGE
jgi:hypothetical protein